MADRPPVAVNLQARPAAAQMTAAQREIRTGLAPEPRQRFAPACIGNRVVIAAQTLQQPAEGQAAGRIAPGNRIQVQLGPAGGMQGQGPCQDGRGLAFQPLPLETEPMQRRSVMRIGPGLRRGTQADSFEGRIAVARVFDPALAARGQQRQQLGLRDAEQRSQQPHAVERPDRAHAREPHGPAAMRGAQPVGLGLVVAVMRDAEVEDRLLAAIVGEQPIARFARRRLDAGSRLRVGPGQDAMGDAGKMGEPASHLLRLGSGFRPQPMVDRQGVEASVPAVRPFGQQQGQRQAVGSAGNGDGKMRRALERAEARHQAGETLRWECGRKRRGQHAPSGLVLGLSSRSAAGRGRCGP